MKTADQIKNGQLRVWWNPQVGQVKSTTFDVPNVASGKVLLDALARYDAYQFENRIKPDHSNAGGLIVWDESLDGADKWTDWESADYESIDELTLEQCIALEAQ